MSPDNVVSILRQLPTGLLSEFTAGGQPKGVTPLHMMCGGGDRIGERQDICSALIRLSASVNIKHRDTGAPLIITCWLVGSLAGLLGGLLTG